LLENKFSNQPMTAADLTEVVALERLSYPQPWRPEQFLQELENPVSRLELLRVDGRLCGYLCYWLIVGEMQILNIATAPDWRRQGVADRLLTQAFARLGSEGLTSAWLEVREGNMAALSLYRRHGFVVAGSRAGYYRDGENALLMVRNFT
jgi:ribosomal-protein-alanine N-acetyltransferase